MKPGARIRPIHGEYPEFTWAAILVGWGIGVVLTVSVAYASLMLGFSIEGSELAAILGWGILRGVMRRTSIVENNINQTIASAVNGASSGIMFSVPALLILSKREQFAELADINQPLLVLAAMTGCVLGLCFVIPLRKQMIDFDRLAYPGGIAVATILKSPGAGVRKAMLLLGGMLIAAISQLAVLQFLGEEANWPLGAQLDWPPMLNIALYVSIMTVGVGYLSGKGGFWFGAGGFLCYFVLSPLLTVVGAPEVAEMTSQPTLMRINLYRPTGIGMLVGAAIGGIIGAAPMIFSAVTALSGASSRAGGEVAAKDEMPIGLL
ncbi:MAG: oligopeptide transporter OPT family protein, partial [Planctomycetota bacterium]